MGHCLANNTPEQLKVADLIDNGPWENLIHPAIIETRQLENGNGTSVYEALFRVLRHKDLLIKINPADDAAFDIALRIALTNLVNNYNYQRHGDGNEDEKSKSIPVQVSRSLMSPPPGSASSLRYLRDRISCPRDMSLYAARYLRKALEDTARLDPLEVELPEGTGVKRESHFHLPIKHRRDQDPAPFVNAKAELLAQTKTSTSWWGK